MLLNPVKKKKKALFSFKWSKITSILAFFPFLKKTKVEIIFCGNQHYATNAAVLNP